MFEPVGVAARDGSEQQNTTLQMGEWMTYFASPLEFLRVVDDDAASGVAFCASHHSLKFIPEAWQRLLVAVVEFKDRDTSAKRTEHRPIPRFVNACVQHGAMVVV